MTGFLVTMTLAGSACVLMGQSYIITTVAGSAKGLEDGGTGAQAVLILPVAVVADPAGNIYVSDQIYGRIRKIDGTTGIISTLTSVATFPSGMALDSAGAFLYVADDSNHRVRKVDTKTGETTTLAGTGSGGFSGDGHLATAARLRNPRAVWVDSNNNVFIADTKNNRIRRVDASTGVIRTIAGAGGQNMTVSTPSGTAALVDNNPAGDGGKATRAQLANPEGVIGDTSGNIYIADTNFHRIRKVDSAGIISTVAGLGTPGSADSIDAPRAQFNAPRGLALDSHGNLYIADSNNNRIPQLLFTRNFVRTVAGAGTAGDDKQALIAALNFPSGVSFDPAGNLLIADQNNSTIRRVDVKTHLISTVAGTSRSYGDGGPAKSAIFSNPRGVAVDKLGNIYVSDTNGHRVRKVSTSGVVDAFAGSGVSGNGPTGRAVSARISSPGCVAVDASGSVLFAGRLNSKIRRVDTNGVMSNVVSADAETLDKNGRLIRSTPASGYNGDGAIAVFSRPNILTGSSGSQHLSATGANLGGDGILSAGTGGNSSGPNCISADNSGNVYIADTGNNVIRKVDAGGIINTVVGYITVVPDKNGVPVNTGVVGSEGDGGLN